MNKFFLYFLSIIIPFSLSAQAFKNVAIIVKPAKLADAKQPGELELMKLKDEIGNQLTQNSRNIFLIDESIFKELQKKMLNAADELTADDIRDIGAIPNADYMLVCEYTKTGIMSTRHYVTAKLIDGGSIIYQATEENSEINEVAEILVRKIIDRIFNLIIEYQVNLKPDKLMINGELIVAGTSETFSFPAGNVDIFLERVGYRSIDTLIQGEPGSIHTCEFKLIEKGAMLKISGSPDDMRSVLLGKKKLVFNDLPFSTYLTEGSWELTLARKGFLRETFQLQVMDDEDLVKRYTLQLYDRNTAIKKNLILPGLGQTSMGYKARGFLYNGIFAAGIAAAVYFSYEYLSLRSDYFYYEDDIRDAIGSDRDALQALQPDIETVNKSGTKAAVAIGLVTFSYSWSISEVFLLHNKNQRLLNR